MPLHPFYLFDGFIIDTALSICIFIRYFRLVLLSPSQLIELWRSNLVPWRVQKSGNVLVHKVAF
jgi:hypothetical protein